jgi:hypothetical protein
MRKLRPKLTYANVVSTICLVLLLGGGAAFAANQLGKNTVGTKQLKKNSVTTAKIKKGAVTGAKISASTFGTVPSAVNAQSLGGLSADQIAQNSKLRCPAGTELSSGVCFETAARPPAQFLEALNTCASIGRSLPSTGELATYLVAKGIENEQNWTGSFFTDGGFRSGFVIVSGSIIVGTAEFASTVAYRCVIGATN